MQAASARGFTANTLVAQNGHHATEETVQSQWWGLGRTCMRQRSLCSIYELQVKGFGSMKAPPISPAC